MNTSHTKISKHKPSVFQGRLALEAVSKPRTSLAVEYPAERVMLHALVAVLIGLVLCYLYFVSASVINIMARKEALARAASIDASIGSLESNYFALSKSISPESAATLGLAPIQQTDYVDRPGTVGMVQTAPENRI